MMHIRATPSLCIAAALALGVGLSAVFLLGYWLAMR